MESPFRWMEGKETRWSGAACGLPSVEVGSGPCRPNGSLPGGTGTQLTVGSSTQTKKHKVHGTTLAGPACT